MSLLRAVLERLALVVGGVVVFAAVLELALPRIVPVTDDVKYEYFPKVGLRLEAGQTGRYLRAGIDGSFRTNADGFNNPHAYTTARPATRRRVAVLGDSFVEALQVAPDQAFFSVLERSLAADGVDAEVYSFGVSGFGTSQVYELLKDHVLRYAPDAVVYLFIVNDVSDSSPCLARAAWTQQYDLGPDGHLARLPLARYEPSVFRRWAGRSATARYLLYQRRLLERLRASSASAVAEPVAHATTDTCDERSWEIVAALLRRMDAMLRARGIPWLLVWQGDTDPAYYADMRERLRGIAARDGLPFFDPSDSFRAASDGRSFRIEGDGHWNAAGHAVVGRALAPAVERMLAARPAATKIPVARETGSLY